MISLRVLCFLTLAVRELSYVRANIEKKKSLTSPLGFSYRHEDKLDIDIILQNVPPRAYYYAMYYQTGNCQTKQQGCNEKAKEGRLMKPNETIHITQYELDEASIAVIIVLRISTNETCSSIRIIDGVRDAVDIETPFRKACLNQDDSPCHISVNFKNKCEASIPLETHPITIMYDSKESLGSTLAKPPQDHINPPDNLDKHQEMPSDKTKYFIGIASVAGIIILISLMYVGIKKYYRRSSDPEQTLQLDSYARPANDQTNMVLYAELDIRPGDAPPPAHIEDPTYAKIIGVLRPQNKNVK